MIWGGCIRDGERAFRLVGNCLRSRGSGIDWPCQRSRGELEDHGGESEYNAGRWYGHAWFLVTWDMTLFSHSSRYGYGGWNTVRQWGPRTTSSSFKNDHATLRLSFYVCPICKARNLRCFSLSLLWLRVTSRTFICLKIFRFNLTDYNLSFAGTHTNRT